MRGLLGLSYFFSILFRYNHSMRIFDGNYHAQLLDEKIKRFLETHKVSKKLAIIQVGDNLASTKYVNLKKRYCTMLGVPVEVCNINSDNKDDIIVNKVRDVFEDETIGGGIIQLPLPRKSLGDLLNIIPIEKDIDTISNIGITQFYAGDFSRLSPVVRATMYYLNICDIPKGITATIIGEGDLVGKPLAFYLTKMGNNVQIIPNYATGMHINCQLLVLSAGVPNLVQGQDILPGVAVIDFGSSVVNGKTTGDLDLNSNLNHLSWVSPSPGGMGPLVIRFLVMNFLGI